MAKTKELRELSLDELKTKETESSQELFNLRLRKATGQLSNTAATAKTRKDLARIKTIIRETQRAGEKRLP
ncbi:MAG: 50S ribosomal protein L29 [Deltaproteobacteria bacterium]|nr:50S ribosomal protein L29 [Deltaproteobacteria bacterium]